MLLAIDSNTLEELLKEFKELNQALKTQSLEEMYYEILTPVEAAKYLKISDRHLHYLKNSGQISFSKYGRIVRYLKKDLDNWIEFNRVTTRLS